MLDIDGATVRMLIRAFAAEVAACLAEHEDVLIDQRDRRGLIGRRHIEAVRRRRAEGAGGAYKRGRDYLLTPAAVREELERGGGHDDTKPRPSRRKKSTVCDPEQAKRERLKRELEAEMRAARNR